MTLNILNVITKIIQYVPMGIQIAEMIFGGKKASEKKDYVLQNVANIINIVEGISDKDIVDQAAFQEGVQMVNDGVVKMLNASAWYKPPVV